METVTLQPLQHQGKDCIGIYFANSNALNNAVKTIPGSRWTKTYKCWHVPLSRDAYNLVTGAFNELAQIDAAALRAHLVEKKKTTSSSYISLPEIANIVTSKTPVLRQGSTLRPPLNEQKLSVIQAINAHVLPNMKQQLVLKAYSPSTLKTYLNEMSQLLQTLGKKEADQLTPDLLKRYLVYCFEKLHLKENTLHSRINALKFYYEQVLGREKFFWLIPRPKKPLLLPKLLNEEELRKLFNALTNKKHKAMLFTAYSAGLRVSEIVNLKMSHIDSKRMQIFIERAKGKKDRYVNLSPVLLDILRKYIAGYKPRPVKYLFESEQTHGSYPTRTVQQVFNNAKTRAGIKKEVGIHSLRHSFATHLLDKGTDIRYIKDLLGHFDIRTTERYLHVSKQQLVNIISPLDDLINKENIEW